MKEKRIYQCEDSLEGIFSAVYIAWASRYGHDNIELEVLGMEEEYNLKLFSEYIIVENNPKNADKVANSIKNKISPHAYQMVARAALSNDKRKANAIYHFLVRGFAFGAKVEDNLSDPYVQIIFELNRYVGNDAHLYTGFVRFIELNNGILFAKIEPKNNVLEIITPHFADRLTQENFMILDVKRKIATVHKGNAGWILTTISDEELATLLSVTEKKEKYEKLWKTFFESIAIKERENKTCQRNHVALHYRKYMTEFMDDVEPKNEALRDDLDKIGKKCEENF
jgi:probable DNA metabolism protein